MQPSRCTRISCLFQIQFRKTWNFSKFLHLPDETAHVPRLLLLAKRNINLQIHNSESRRAQ